MGGFTLTAVAIVGVVAAVLAVPVHLDVRIEWLDHLRGEVRLRWLFNLVHVAVTPGKASADGTSRRTTASRPAVPSQRPHAMTLLRTRGLWRRVVRLVRDLRAAVCVRQLVIRARFGFADPADTGRACGALMPLAALASTRGIDIRFMPDFERAVLHAAGAGTISVTPLRVIAALAAFAASPPVWRAIGTWRSK